MVTRVESILEQKGPDVVTVTGEQTVFEAIGLMAKRHIGSVVVLDGSRVTGIFTERDYLRRIVLEGRTSKTTQVCDVMTRDVAYVDPSATLVECMGIMTAHRCRRLPVIVEGGLVGILTIGDCVKRLSADAEFEIRLLQEYIAGTYPG